MENGSIKREECDPGKRRPLLEPCGARQAYASLQEGAIAVQTGAPSRADMEICSLNQPAVGAQPWRPAELILPDQLPQSLGGSLCHPMLRTGLSPRRVEGLTETF